MPAVPTFYCRASRRRQLAAAKSSKGKPTSEVNDEASGVTVIFAGSEIVASATSVSVSGLKFGSLGSALNTL